MRFIRDFIGDIVSSIFFLIVILGAVILIAVALILYRVYAPPVIFSSVTSPSGKVTAIKQYDGYETPSYTLYLEQSHWGIKSSTQILPPQSIPEGTYNNDGILFGWENDHHLTIGWPEGMQPIHGPSRIEGIDISYQTYMPDVDRISGGNEYKISLHEMHSIFTEQDLQREGETYSATGQPVPNIKCIIEIDGLDGKAFEGIKIQIIGDGIGRSSDSYPSFGGIGVKYIFINPVGQYALLTPTQAKLNSIFSQSKRDAPRQENLSLYYQRYTLSEALELISGLQKGSFTMKVGLNLGQEILTYEGNVRLGNDIIDKFNACSAKTNIYGAPFHVSY